MDRYWIHAQMVDERLLCTMCERVPRKVLSALAGGVALDDMCSGCRKATDAEQAREQVAEDLLALISGETKPSPGSVPLSVDDRAQAVGRILGAFAAGYVTVEDVPALAEECGLVEPA